MNKVRQQPFSVRQRGSVLLLSLFMLMIMTMLALAAIKMGTVTLRTVNNMQIRGEAMSAAQDVINRILATKFTDDLNAVATTYSYSADATKDYSVVVESRPCVRQVTPIMNTSLDIDNAADLACYAASPDSKSACSNVVWELKAKVNDGWFGANVEITQGAGVRMDNGKAAQYALDVSYRCS
jgi:hypothetical protein